MELRVKKFLHAIRQDLTITVMTIYIVSIMPIETRLQSVSSKGLYCWTSLRCLVNISALLPSHSL